MRNKIYDDKSLPVNKMAAIAISRGTHYDPKCKIQVDEFISPPAIIPKRMHPKHRDFIDLTGRRKGRFTVVGLLDCLKSSLWVVRCDCGTYTTRTAKSIKAAETKKASHLDACRECMHLAYIKREEIWRRTGRDANIEDVF